MIDLEFDLPWGNSANTHWRVWRTGKMAGRPFLSTAGQRFRKAVAAALRDQDVECAKLTCRIAVHVDCHAPNRRKYDLDNRLKPLLDALITAGLVADDECFDEIVLRRRPIVPGGVMRVRLRELAPALAVVEQADLCLDDAETFAAPTIAPCRRSGRTPRARTKVGSGRD